ncbi:histone-like nucleoid-structuring protein Lsr2 [Streptomyces sp. NPDC048362]|uniref:Lsr2 dimerization domain-containing protein n=1 Tax=Streptomyces sp. NPDC048362 TaxID=3365539 RepID=UPI0037130801
MTGHHHSCPVETISGLGCDCQCHIAHTPESAARAVTRGDSDTLQVITFGLDGLSYEIDLSAGQVCELRAALHPFVSAARLQGDILQPPP